MYCCINCFKDAQIKAIIEGYKSIDNCDFCGEKNAYVYQIGTDTAISEPFDGLLDVYSAVASLPDTFPKDNTDLIKNILYNKWNIFNVEPDRIYRLITSICHEKYGERPELFDTPVGIAKSQDQNYLEEKAIIKNYSWADFVVSIKQKNRFHTDHMNKGVLDLFIEYVLKTYKIGDKFYRARICPSKNGFSIDEMGAPPPHLATAGRVNPEGISVLYLADTEKTALHEVRAGVHDYVTIGCFELLKDMGIINLADMDKISPFTEIDYTQHAVNKEHLRMISQEVAKPLRRQDSPLDYLPTQYISDFIKSKGYDGIKYISTMCPDGVNLAIFDESLFRCISTNVCEIKSLEYSHNKVK
jgi:hypothetical protein